MSDKTLTKADIVDIIYEKTERNRNDVKKLVESLLKLSKQAIKKECAEFALTGNVDAGFWSVILKRLQTPAEA